jgi:addiction module HigA family antidote
MQRMLRFNSRSAGKQLLSARSASVTVQDLPTVRQHTHKNYGDEMKSMRRPSQPGEILAELYLGPHEIPIAQFAEACGVTRKHMSRIVNGRVLLTAAMALRVAKALGTTTPEYWLSLQNAVDLYDAQERNGAFRRQAKRAPMALEEART